MEMISSYVPGYCFRDTHERYPPTSFLQPRLLPVLEKFKSAYLTWAEYRQKLPKEHRYSLGEKIDELFIASMEAIAAAGFLSSSEKQPYVRLAIRKLDIAKIMLMILWETKSLDTKKYIALSEKLDETGRMLGGWHGQMQKQNSPARK
jgi:23S rRNA-intervening sequence protein